MQYKNTFSGFSITKSLEGHYCGIGIGSIYILSYGFGSGIQARPLFRDRKKFPKMADPLLQGCYPMRGLYQALAVAAMCLQEQAATRPLIGDVVTALSYLASQTYDPNAASAQSNRVGPSTPRAKDERKSLGGVPSSQDEMGHGGNRGVPSPKNSPDFRNRDSMPRVSFGADIGRGDSGGGSGRKWGLDEHGSQRDSPVHAGKVKEGLKNSNRDLERERAVAEAKMWGENWRERKRSNASGSSEVANK